MERSAQTSSPPYARFIKPSSVFFAVLWLGITIETRASLRLGWLAFFAVVCGLALLFPARASRTLRFLLLPKPLVYVAAVALGAVALSVAFVFGPMMNKPVSIDANVYLFEARMLAQGTFGAAVPPPRLAYSARFLFEGPDGRLFGVFPPGYPFFLAPFVRLGIPLWSGPLTAALWVFTQNSLGRSVLRAGALPAASPDDDRAELGHRLGLLIPLFAFERALHTADLLSHAFVAALAAFALAGAIDLACGRGTWRDAAGVGVLLGWIFAARMLDGALLGIVVLGTLGVGVARKKVGAAKLAAVVLCAIPFLGLLAAQQKASTGSATLPTQTEYFLRSDWPPTCHRIGFGPDIGCTVEHSDAPAKIGADGYGVDDAVRVIRERGAALGQDLFGLSLLGLFAFWTLWRRPHPALLALASAAFAILLGYGLFYFGNVQWYGGRHVLPAATFLWVLVGHGVVIASDVPEASRVDGEPGPRFASKRARLAVALPFAAALTMLFAGQRAWTKNSPEIEAKQSGRSDVRRTLTRHKVDRGIFRSSDNTALVAALDPARDGDRVHLVPDDKSGLLDVRRFYPELPLILSLEKDEIGRALGLAPPPPGILVELERAWPSFQRPRGLAASVEDAQKLPVPLQPAGAPSGGRALVVSHASPGATLRVPFEVARAGRYALRLASYGAPDYGIYAVSIDGAPLVEIDGYAPAREYRRGTESEPRELTAGAHVLEFEARGKNAESRDYSAAFDALIGVLKE